MIRLVAALLGAVVPAAGPPPTETLADAIHAALASNPVLGAARDRQDALAETPEQARAPGRLTADGTAIGGYDRFDFGRGAVATVSATLPVWTGTRVSSAVRAATRDVAAGEQSLRDVAATVVEQAVVAYAGVLFQQQAVAIARSDIALLDNQVAEARARFQLGTGTQTDVARLAAQQQGAVATLAADEAALASAAAQYRAVIGHPPGALASTSGNLGDLPPSLDEARRRSITANPPYLAAVAARGAADARIEVARANGMPSIALGAGYGYGLSVGRGPAYLHSAAAGVTLRVPILTGGLVASQVRQATAGARAASHDAEAAAREAVRATDSAWANLAAARTRVAAGEREVVAAERALAGVKAEYVVALRTTLDILIADESLRAAQLSLASARADLLTSEAALLRATGSLDTAAT